MHEPETAARGQDCTTPSFGDTQMQLHIQVPEGRWKSEATFDLAVGEALCSF